VYVFLRGVEEEEEEEEECERGGLEGRRGLVSSVLCLTWLGAAQQKGGGKARAVRAVMRSSNDRCRGKHRSLDSLERLGRVSMEMLPP